MRELKVGDVVETRVPVGVPMGIIGVQPTSYVICGVILEIGGNLVRLHCAWFGSYQVPKWSCTYVGSLSKEEMLTDDDEIVRQWAISHDF